MIVCSLFDGMSCGQLAFQRAGIKVDKYFASEIDKYAIKITQKNFPNTIQLGDIRNIKGSDLGHVDIVIGGSPCQGFSFASNDKLNFDHPQSKLFFEYVRLLKEINPKYFLLENVMMDRQNRAVINDYMEIFPIELNSSSVSAQNRQRLYWTNIPNIRKPKDKGIMLSDILEDDVRHPVYSNIYGGYGKSHMIHKYKAPTLKVGGEPPFATLKKYVKDHLPDNYITFNKAHIRLFTARECERLQTVPDDYTAGVSKTQRYKMLGNGWTIDILSTIFKNLQGNPKPLKKIKQLKLL